MAIIRSLVYFQTIAMHLVRAIAAAVDWFLTERRFNFIEYKYIVAINTKIISITQIMIASIKTGLKAELRERGSIISHHLDHSCLIYQEMFFRITFCLDWDVLSMSD